MGICCSDRGRPSLKRFNSVINCTQAFQQPAQPIGAANTGTRFFRLVHKDAQETPKQEHVAVTSDGEMTSAKSKTWPLYGEVWLGKDLSQAFDELEFYDDSMHLRYQDQWGIFDYTAEYYGVAWGTMCVGPNQRVRTADLLIFRSPLEGLARPRLVNLELSPRCSSLQLSRGSPLDTVLIARQEGIRVEGFMAPPVAIPSEAPACDSKGWAWGDVSQRRAERLHMQRLSVAEALAAFVDFRDAITEELLWPSTLDLDRDAFSNYFLISSEFSELVTLAAVRELVSLVQKCGDVPAPQKWLGTSLCLIADVGAAPPRQCKDCTPEAWVEARFRLRVSGFGRSAVSCPLQNGSNDNFQENDALWQIYKDSVNWILWEMARLYFHSFCVQAWTHLRVEVLASNVKGVELLIGYADIVLDLAGHPSQRRRVVSPLLHGNSNTAVKLHGEGGQLSEFSLLISFSDLPSTSRFAGVWRVRAEDLKSLPVPIEHGADKDMISVSIVAQDKKSSASGDSCCVVYRTKAIQRSTEMCWQEEFELPVCRAESGSKTPFAEVGVKRLADALGCPDDDAAGYWAKLLPKLATSSAWNEEKRREDSLRHAAEGQVAFTKAIQNSWTKRGPFFRNGKKSIQLPTQAAKDMEFAPEDATFPADNSPREQLFEKVAQVN